MEQLSAVRRESDSLYARPAEAAAVELGISLQPDAASEVGELAARLGQLEVRAAAASDARGTLLLLFLLPMRLIYSSCTLQQFPVRCTCGLKRSLHILVLSSQLSHSTRVLCSPTTTTH